MGYRINSTSFWPGDLEIDQVKEIVRDLERKVDLDYVSVSAGVHHSFIHTPMHFEGGVGEGLRGRGAQGFLQARPAGRPDHHARRRGAAPEGRPRRRHLPRPPALHRSRVGEQGAGRAARTTSAAAWPRTCAGETRPPGSASSASTTRPSGARGSGGSPRSSRRRLRRRCSSSAGDRRGSSARGWRRRAATGSPCTSASRRPAVTCASSPCCPTAASSRRRGPGSIGRARKNGAEIVAKHPVDEGNLDEVLAREDPDHVVVATGSRVCVDGFQGVDRGGVAPAGRPAAAWAGMPF